jgi:pyruvate dehydrogenase E2 component (dihydrolipoamide acetyltransferase)
MVREFRLPDVGEGLTEAEIVAWLVEVGDEVVEDQPVAEVETDKAVVEVPAPVDGTVREIRAEAGEMVPVGEVIVTFDVAGEPTETGDGAATDGTADTQTASDTDHTGGDGPDDTDGSGRVFAAPSARRLARELGVDLGSVAGSGPGGRVNEADVRAAAEATAETTSDDAVSADTTDSAPRAVRRVTDAAENGTDGTEPHAPTGGPEPAGRERTLAAPATRRLAEEAGVDLDDVPTDEERDGQAFVAPEHVRAYTETQQAAQAADTRAVQQEPPATDTATTGEVERVPYRGVRRTIGEAMERSKNAAPHVTHHDTAVVEKLVETRTNLVPRAEKRGVRLTYLPFVVKAVVAALKRHPILNSQLNEADEEILLKRYYNVGVAVATDAGLMVPVVENVDEKDMLTVASEVNELASKARDRSISREEMQGGTFSITNFGAIGGEYATPILNHPETAILGLGELRRRPVVEGGGTSETPRASGAAAGEVVARHTLPLSLSIDHRVVDGADGAAFVNTLKEYLAEPELLLLE